MGLNLLEKTELWVNNITLDNANLTELAETVADTLRIERSKVLVVDVRPQHITLDILEKEIPEENILGKKKLLLKALSKLSGVNITEETYIHSNGILGMICLDPENPKEILCTINNMVSEMKEKISKRAIVFPTGFEVKEKLIEDTNTPYLKEVLEQEGFKVTVGDVIEDDIDDMIFKLDEAVSKAYGLIITTGGVGAEDKDKTVESVLKIDPQAITPYIVKFKQGTGRHVKDGVKIAVGNVGPSLIVSMPGPNDEVQIATKVLIECLKNNCDKTQIAHKIAGALAAKLTLHKHDFEKHHGETHK
jgi:molybdenum cofactor synthesis domain-containing protein